MKRRRSRSEGKTAQSCTKRLQTAAKLIKNKDILDSENANVRAVFNALFKGNNKVSVSKLDHSFMLSSGAVCTSENIQGQTALYEPKAKKNKGIISSCIFAGMVLLTVLLFITTSAYFRNCSSVSCFCCYSFTSAVTHSCHISEH